MASIQFYAGQADNESLREFVNSLDLMVYEGEFERPGIIKEVQKDTFSGFISFLRANQLHPYPGPLKNFPYRIGTVTDPLIMWCPSYTMVHDSKKYIIHGHLFWDFEIESRGEELAQGKRIFGQISRWIRKKWPPPSKGSVCTGPHALQLIKAEGYIAQGLPPTACVEYVVVAPNNSLQSRLP